RNCYWLSVIFFICFSFQGRSQEYFLTFTADKSSLGTTSDNTYVNPAFITDMQNAIIQFINNNRWSSQTFKPNEKIKMNIQFTMTDAPNNGVGSFKGTFQVVINRPVFNASYETVVMSFIDKEVEFDYIIGQQMVFNENAFTTNLTALLAFYAYAGLGLDFDSFGPNGGSAFYERLLNVVNTAQSSNAPGWQALVGGNNTRYWFSENLNSQQFQPFREAIYSYHRLGLDIMATEPEKGRANILDALKKIKKVNQVRPNSVLLRSFFNAKSSELVGIFSESKQEEKQEAFDILREIDPTHIDTYQKILNK
ncbi:MAG: DUF4835 family protein, partial [Cytophagales bacterium]|nr:DUF4835 family protein [Cytophagales bacterium]